MRGYSSEEDNDPLTDDAASTISLNATRPGRGQNQGRHTPSSPLAPSRGNAVPNTTSTNNVAPGPGTGTGGNPRQSSRARQQHHHQHGHLSGVISDDGIDSPTYDGDVETTTASARTNVIHSHHAPYDASRLSSASGSVSTLTSPTSAGFVPAGPSSGATGVTAAEAHSMTTAPAVTLTAASQGSLSSPSVSPAATHAPDPLSQQPINVAAVPLLVSEEPPPVPIAAAQFDPANLSADAIRAFVKEAIGGGKTEKGVERTYKINEPPVGRPVRIYADGLFLFLYSNIITYSSSPLLKPSQAFMTCSILGKSLLFIGFFFLCIKFV